jgi:hypothetical protein
VGNSGAARAQCLVLNLDRANRANRRSKKTSLNGVNRSTKRRLVGFLLVGLHPIRRFRGGLFEQFHVS